MNKELQDLVWGILPKGFKEEVKKYYSILHEQYKDYDGLHLENAKSKMQERIVTLEYFFDKHNLTSDADEEDEMLTVSRKDVVELYQEVQKTLSQCKGTALSIQSVGIKNVLWSFFGSKCLPDLTHTIEITNQERRVNMKTESSAVNSYNGLLGQQGWICPKCGRVYSPFTQMCFYCKNETYDVSNLSGKGNESISESKLRE